ncbi:MAG: hypothetical protein Q4F34_05050 [Prevotellaceae bacterium]|nr:hypothetical protein [Prevotellaceae bacterium]
MKKTFLTLLTIVHLAACNQPDHAFYELAGGDANFDFIDFMNDSVVRYIGPEGMEHHSLYVDNGKEITIKIATLVDATLTRIDANTLQGTPPFFQGTWNKRKK